MRFGHHFNRNPGPEIPGLFGSAPTPSGESLQEPKPETKDSKGRTFEDIAKKAKLPLNTKKITYNGKEFLIEETLADKWIEMEDALSSKGDNYYVRGQW